MSNSLIDSTGRYRNILRGIVPTFTGFSDINPTNLANATDGNVTTSTGEAKKILAGAGVLGTFVFDLGAGANKLVLFGGLISIHSSANYFQAYIYSDLYIGNFNVAILNRANPAKEKTACGSKLIYCNRYITLYCYGSGAGDFYIELDDIFAYEVSL